MAELIDVKLQGEALGALGQLVVPTWSDLRCRVTWNNVGAAGSRDLAAFYGKGTNPDDFVPQFYTRVLGVVAAAGQSGIITDLNQISVGPVNVGLWDCLVVVGDYDPATGIYLVDDWMTFPNAVSVQAAVGTVGVYAENFRPGDASWYALWWNDPAWQDPVPAGWRPLEDPCVFVGVPLTGITLYVFSVDAAGIDVADWGMYGPFDVEDLETYRLDLATGTLTRILTGELAAPIIWYSGLAGWEVLLPSRIVPPDTDIYIASYWVNTSGVNVRGHIEMAVIYPDGSTVYPAATSGQDVLLSPGGGIGVNFAPFNTSQGGFYTVSFVLTAEGEVLDTQVTGVVVT